jgi:glycosyltransferase involved in cell wall biosynthesis
MNLIYFEENKLRPSGGPAGYLYNLREGLRLLDNHEIVFLPGSNTVFDKEKAKERMPKRLVELRRALRFMRMHKETDIPLVDLNQYDTVHFHRTDDLYRCRKALESFQGKVILTSHTPCVRFQELIDMLNPKDAKFFARQLKNLEKIDEYAFQRADYVMFPCEEAEEPYYHTWQIYGKIRQAEKYRYLPTGIKPCKARVSFEDVRKKYGIPQDAFVVCYVGRHNEIKGYDLVKKVAEELLVQNSNIYFIIAGREEPMSGLRHKRWIEVGWTNDPHSIISAADVFLLPNRETYFDLIMLEVLSLGQIIIASRTGGNKYFEKYGSDGIKLYTDSDEIGGIIADIMKFDNEQLLRMRNENKNIFNREFTVDKFAREYVRIIQLISSQVEVKE